MAAGRTGEGIDSRRRAGPGRPADPALAERRKAQIVEAAYRVFGERGYHDTGITEIMQAAELGRGTFYLYFDNKREVLDGVVDFTIEQILTAAGAGAGAGDLTSLGDFEDYLRKSAGDLFRLLDENPTLSTVLIRNGMIDEAVTARMLGLSATFSAVVGSYVEQAMDAGILDKTLSITAIAHALTGFAIGGLMRGIGGNFPDEERAAYIDTAIELLRRFAAPAADVSRAEG